MVGRGRALHAAGLREEGGRCGRRFTPRSAGPPLQEPGRHASCDFFQPRPSPLQRQPPGAGPPSLPLNDTSSSKGSHLAAHARERSRPETLPPRPLLEKSPEVPPSLHSKSTDVRGVLVPRQRPLSPSFPPPASTARPRIPSSVDPARTAPSSASPVPQTPDPTLSQTPSSAGPQRARLSTRKAGAPRTAPSCRARVPVVEGLGSARPTRPRTQGEDPRARCGPRLTKVRVLVRRVGLGRSVRGVPGGCSKGTRRARPALARSGESRRYLAVFSLCQVGRTPAPSFRWVGGGRSGCPSRQTTPKPLLLPRLPAHPTLAARRSRSAQRPASPPLLCPPRALCPSNPQAIPNPTRRRPAPLVVSRWRKTPPWRRYEPRAVPRRRPVRLARAWVRDPGACTPFRTGSRPGLSSRVKRQDGVTERAG